MASGVQAAPSSLSNPTGSAPSPHLLKSQPPPRVNTFYTHLVLPFSISIAEFTKQGQGRAEAEGEIRETFTRLVNALESKGLRVTARRGRGKLAENKEVWIFVRADQAKIGELWEKERAEDASIGGNATRGTKAGLTDADEIRLVHGLLVSAPEQGGIGITPGEGEWKRVKSIVAIHDEQTNHEWIQSWMGRDWSVGLRFSQDDSDKVRNHFGEAIATYFSYLSFYTLSLLPASIFGVLFWLLKLKWSWIYVVGITIWGITVVEVWKVQESKLQERFGIKHVDQVEHLRPQFLATLQPASGMTTAVAVRDVQLAKSRTQAVRESKMLATIPVILGSGIILGAVITATFILEAFLAQLYDGPGKQAVALLPTLIFVGVVPSIVKVYHALTHKLTNWENHPTKRSFESSLTVKTFAMNAITAYLGLFLSAYVYVPFGELIMSYLSVKLSQEQHMINTTSAEGAGLSPDMPISKRVGIKGDRLVNQMFAYTVTNQAINAFTELGLPFVMRYVDAWRDNSSIPLIGSAKGKASEDAKAKSSEIELRQLDQEVTPDERKFLDKVSRELSLPEYNSFVDYAEMVTQFGYVTLWSIIWPLAPLFAFVNNYIELRSDAVKICSHVRRPIPVREGAVGVWVDTMTFLTWLAAITNSTLVFLFKPSLDDPLRDQSINPDATSDSFSTYLASSLHSALTRNGTVAAGIDGRFDGRKREVIRAVLPSLIPVLFVALTASHAYMAVRWIIRRVIERTLKSPTSQFRPAATSEGAPVTSKPDNDTGEDAHFWRGSEEGLDEIRRVLKVE